MLLNFYEILAGMECNMSKPKFVNFPNSAFQLYQPYSPAGDQPIAISKLISGLRKGLEKQVLLGVTGSGKTYTMANVIAEIGRPTIILAPNKTLAAQLYSEMREFFPKNSVEYFVSYYDYYQPEAYVPSKDLFVEKDSSISLHVEQLRLSATKSLLERKDTIIIATVSCIYGIGNPSEYPTMSLVLQRGCSISRKGLLKRLPSMQYNRNDLEFARGKFRVLGDSIDVFPAENADFAIRIVLNENNQIKLLQSFDPLTGKIQENLLNFTIYPASHYVVTRSRVLNAMETIKEELREQLKLLTKSGHLFEAQRLEQRTRFDLEMLQEVGFCKGIENYSRHFSALKPGDPPSTLIDYFPKDSLMFIDESHITIGQLSGMFHADQSRKKNLVDYGFRLPSSLDNRPLRLEEFESRMPQCIFVSATPSNYEMKHAENVVEQLVRPTGLVDPIVEVRSAISQVDDLLDQIKENISIKERVIVTTLTKRTAERLSDFLSESGIKVRYLHSDIDIIERTEIIRDFRLGIFDVLIGINLLREGIDIPEASLVAILDADKEGFLRSERSLIQTIGRVARHLNGRAILYAERITDSMKNAINETKRRRNKQVEFNVKNSIIAHSIKKSVRELTLELDKNTAQINTNNQKDKKSHHSKSFQKKHSLDKEIRKLEKLMAAYSENLEFESAAETRDMLETLKKKLATE